MTSEERNAAADAVVDALNALNSALALAAKNDLRIELDIERSQTFAQVESRIHVRGVILHRVRSNGITNGAPR